MTSFSCFKYMSLYSAIQFTSVSFLYASASNLGDFQVRVDGMGPNPPWHVADSSVTSFSSSTWLLSCLLRSSVSVPGQPV